MKKLLIAFFISVLVSASSLTVLGVNVGDYVIMGSYNAEQILWRCVDIDENGPLMLSDKVLCVKPYDSAGSSEGSSNSYGDCALFRSMFGSDRWSDSNLRVWLSSSDTTVNYSADIAPLEDNTWFSMNEYAEENGFLSSENFSANELKLMKNVYLKSVLNDMESDIATVGSEALIYNESILTAGENYSEAYGEMLCEKMFLPDVSQMSEVYANRDILGDYSIAYPTEKAVQNSEYKSSDKINTLLPIKYWLRTPQNFNFGDSVRSVGSDGNITLSYACSVSVGVRPAFYLNESATEILEGSGTAAAPFRLQPTDEKYVSLSNIDTQNGVFSANISYSGFEGTASAQLIYAVYGENELLYINTSTVTDFTGSTISLTLPEASEKLKVFVWENANKIPVCNAISVDLK